MKLNVVKLNAPYNAEMYYRENTTDLNCIIEIFERKEYQSKKLGIIFEPGSQEGKLWLDLGANIGAFTKLIQCCGGKTIAFEPIEENFEVLEKNLGNSSSAFNCCVTTRKAEKISFYTATKDSDKYRFTEHANSRPIGIVSNICVTELFDIPDVWGIKMDIEGSEFSIIDENLIPNCEILVGEYHFSKDKNMRNFHKRMEILKSNFEIVHYQPFLNKYDLDKPYPLAMDKMFYCLNRKK